MIIEVPNETTTNERRVALMPDVAEKLVAAGHDVCIETGAGEDADCNNDASEAVGCEICDREAVFERFDAVLRV